MPLTLLIYRYTHLLSVEQKPNDPLSYEGLVYYPTCSGCTPITSSKHLCYDCNSEKVLFSKDSNAGRALCPLQRSSKRNRFLLCWSPPFLSLRVPLRSISLQNRLYPLLASHYQSPSPILHETMATLAVLRPFAPFLRPSVHLLRPVFYTSVRHASTTSKVAGKPTLTIK